MPFSLFSNNTIDNSDITKISKYDNGTTVFAGDNVIDKNNIKKYPIVSNMGYLFKQIGEGELVDAFFSVATGCVPLPITDVVSGNVSNNGIVDDFEGPGHIEINNNKIEVISPDSIIYGYNTPYIQAVKTSDGIDIKNNKTNQTIKHIAGDNINNDTIDSDRVSGDSVAYWYNRASVGAKYNLEYGLSSFSDNRSIIAPDQLKEEFPDAYNYSLHYPGGSPVIIYEKNVSEVKVSSSYTYLGSHPQYNDANREYNARQFVKAWNNTIIPANGSACGREDVGFSAIAESEAESGMATHGVCPPARALRNAVIALGFDMPVGMTSGRDAVLYGFSPSTGIFVHNKLDYPIKIVMWTDGSGTGMGIGATIYELIPDYKNTTSTNSTNSTN